MTSIRKIRRRAGRRDCREYQASRVVARWEEARASILQPLGAILGPRFVAAMRQHAVLKIAAQKMERLS